MVVKIIYTLDNDNWTDEDYYNQEEQTFVITEDMIKELINNNVKIESESYISDLSIQH